MCLRKNTLLQRVPDLDIELRSNIDVRFIVKGESFLGDQHTLAILDVFSTPKSFEEGLGALIFRFKGARSLVGVTSQIFKLYECGILKSPSYQNPILPSYPTRFDDSPIHIRMLYDRHRTLSSQKVIRETATSADIVIDIGTGMGVLAATATMAGAKHVYAIEISSMAKLAQRVFDMNGLYIFQLIEDDRHLDF